MNKPIVGITMGDPAGSGPEITIKALADPEQYSYCRPIVVGDVKVMEQAKKFVGREDIVIHRCEKVSDALFTPGTIDVLHLDLIEDINKFEMAKVSVEGGNAAFQCVKKVIELAMAGEVDATCTNALNKEAMNKALEYYQKEKWSRASTLFEGVQHYYIGTPREDSVSFFNARCKFKNRDYDTASTLLDDFRRKFGRSAFIEDAEGMYALCFYYLSPGPSRDQTMTGQALIAINEFMSRYPHSDRVEDFKQINGELTQRLHDKSYLNAYTYYKIGRYKSAIVSLKNALKQFPDSNHREEIMYMIVDASYRFANNSIANKQTDRYLSMLDSYLSFKEEFPESKYTKEVDRMAKHARDYLDRNKKDEDKDNNI